MPSEDIIRQMFGKNHTRTENTSNESGPTQSPCDQNSGGLTLPAFIGLCPGAKEAYDPACAVPDLRYIVSRAWALASISALPNTWKYWSEHPDQQDRRENMVHKWRRDNVVLEAGAIPEWGYAQALGEMSFDQFNQVRKEAIDAVANRLVEGEAAQHPAVSEGDRCVEGGGVHNAGFVCPRLRGGDCPVHRISAFMWYSKRWNAPELDSLADDVIPKDITTTRTAAENFNIGIRLVGRVVKGIQGGNPATFFVRNDGMAGMLGDGMVGIQLRKWFGRCTGLSHNKKNTQEMVQIVSDQWDAYAEKAEVADFSHYVKETNTLYVFLGDTKMLKVTKDDITVMQNGAEAVVFVGVLEPWEFGDPDYDALKELVLDNANLARGASITLDDSRRILTSYLASVFYHNDLSTKPILVFVGDPGSGKSWAQKAISKLIYGGREGLSTIKSGEDGEKDYIALVTKKKLIGLDNVHSRIKWLPERLAQTATKGYSDLRKLYTTNDVETVELNAFITMSSVDTGPAFGNFGDVEQRSLIFRVQPRQHRTNETKLKEEIQEKRGGMLSALMLRCQKVLQVRDRLDGDLPAAPESFRMADWASIFTALYGDEDMDGVARILAALQNEQQEVRTEDPFIQFLLEPDIQQQLTGKEVSATEVASVINRFAKEIDIKYNVTPVGCGRRIQQLIEPLRISGIDIDIKQKHGKQMVYRLAYRNHTNSRNSEKHPRGEGVEILFDN